MTKKQTAVENNSTTHLKKQILGVVKEFRTSKFYGVRLDKRINGEKITCYYRVDIEAENKKYYLGAYLEEKHAAYAFNVGFNFLSNGHFKIENIVELNKSDAEFVFEKVRKLILKH